MGFLDELPGMPGSRARLQEDLELLMQELDIIFESETLFRKGGLAVRRRALEAAFSEESRRSAELRGFATRKNPEEVVVAMSIHAPGTQQPLMPDVVKAHLDALQGIAYEDDRQVAGLIVHRHAWDHPMLEGHADREPGLPSVYVHVGLREAYTRLYDRMFRKEIWSRGADSAVRPGWRLKDEMARARELAKGQRPGAITDEIRLVQRETLADHDRPGPLTPDQERVERLLRMQPFHAFLRRRLGATIILPLQGQGEGTSEEWAAETDRILQAQWRHRSMVQEPLTTFVALDIAVRGQSVDGKDLDNLARSIIDRFEPIFCAKRGTVVSYRAYRATGVPEGIQVRILSSEQMLRLEIAMGETRGAMVDRLSELEAKARRDTAEPPGPAQ